MSRTEYSLFNSGFKGLRNTAAKTAFAIEIANGTPDLERRDIANATAIPRDPTAEEIRRFGNLRAAYQAIGMANVKQRVADERWGLEASKYVFESPDFQEMDRRYHEAIALRALLASIAHQNEGRAKADDGDIVLSLPQSTDLLGSLKLRVSRSSRQAHLEPEGLLEAILNEGELARVKRCAYEKCQRFFWAARVDRPCCQESCRNAYRQRRHRERVKQYLLIKKKMKRRNRND